MKKTVLLALALCLALPLTAWAYSGNPPTGDTENIWIWISLLLAGVDLFLGALLFSNRRPEDTSARTSRSGRKR